MKLDWDRLNHVLIPVPTAERRRRSRPLPPWVSRLIDLAFSVTGAGYTCLVAAAVLGGLSLVAPLSKIPFLFGFVLGLFVVSVGLRRFFRVREGRAGLEQPTRITVGEAAELRVVVTALDPASALGVRGPFLPWFAGYEGEPPTLRQERGALSASATVRVRFTRRSDLFLGPFAVARRLPFDLVSGPPIETEPFRIKIVPRPARITRLDLPPSRDFAAVALRGSRRGGVADLAGVREYRQGDKIRDLDARTWARTGIPMVREWHDPELSRALLLLDTDAEEGDAFEAAVSLTAGVAEVVAAGDLAMELLVIGEALHRLDAGRGRAALTLVLDALAVAEPGGRFDGERTLARLVPFLSHAEVLVLITTRWDPSRARVAEALSRRGLAPRVLVVSDSSPRSIPTYARWLSPPSIKRGGLVL